MTRTDAVAKYEASTHGRLVSASRIARSVTAELGDAAAAGDEPALQALNDVSGIVGSLLADLPIQPADLRARAARRPFVAAASPARGPRPAAAAMAPTTWVAAGGPTVVRTAVARAVADHEGQGSADVFRAAMAAAVNGEDLELPPGPVVGWGPRPPCPQGAVFAEAMREAVEAQSHEFDGPLYDARWGPRAAA